MGGTVGAGYSGIAVSRVLERLGMSVFRGGGPAALVVVLRAGSVRELSDDDEVRDDVGLELLVVRAVVVVRWAAPVVVVCGGLFVVVSAGVSSSLLLLLPLPWATTRKAKKAVRSKARFSESGDEAMAAAVSHQGDAGKGRVSGIC